MYKLTVTKAVPNPNFSQKMLDTFLKKSDYGYTRNTHYQPGLIDKEMEKTILTVELTEEEFKAMKKSVIKTVK